MMPKRKLTNSRKMMSQREALAAATKVDMDWCERFNCSVYIKCPLGLDAGKRIDEDRKKGENACEGCAIFEGIYREKDDKKATNTKTN